MPDSNTIRLMALLVILISGGLLIFPFVQADGRSVDPVIQRMASAIQGLEEKLIELTLYAKLIDAQVSQLQANQTVKTVHRFLPDDETGHDAGWDPDDFAQAFAILDNSITPKSVVSLTVDNGGASGSDCHIVVLIPPALPVAEGGFKMFCDGPILDGATLNYTVTNPIEW